ncbi:MAG: SdiA-regulated domain-containing protein, partial [Candidatus Aminicenantes bacterium]|nr:SdiA-regulated domain-containing protein [Candidatus Aminicenantes bacterium]
MKRLLFILSLCLLAACGQPVKDGVSIRFPYRWMDEPGFGGNIDGQNIEEPSGIVFHPIRGTLFVVSDEGGLYEIGTDGSPVGFMDIPGDLEGLTVHPGTGLLYIVREGEDVILEVDPDRKTVLRRFLLNREYAGNPEFIEKRTDSFDNGIECIAFIPDEAHSEGGTFILGNQWDPSCLIEVEVPLLSSTKESDTAVILRVLPFKLDDPAGMYFDARTGRLNVVSDVDNILVELTLSGRLVGEYAFPGDNQEGLTQDD